jgi:cytochrome c553
MSLPTTGSSLPKLPANKDSDMKKLIIALCFSTVSLSACAGGNAANGKALLADKQKVCASCHGVDYNTPIDPSYPKLAGQHADYLTHALTAYKRGNKGYGRNNAIMSGMVQTLSDKDMADIAAYLSSLPSGLAVHR